MRRVLPGRRTHYERSVLGTLLRRAHSLTDLHAILVVLHLAARLARLAQRWRPRRLRRLVRRGLVPALALALLVAPLRAQSSLFPVPFTGEFLVDSATGQGGAPAVAMSPTGSFATTWVDTSNTSILVSVYDAQGSRISGPTLVSGSTRPFTTISFRPDIAMDGDGDFVVAWSGETSGELSTEGLFAQRFDAEGTLLGQQLLITTISSGSLRTPGVAMDEDGDFALAWHRDVSGEDDLIETRRFDAAGNPRGGPDSPLSTGQVEAPSIAMDVDGNAVIAWREGNGIVATRVRASSGELLPVNAGQPLNDPPTGSIENYDPAVAMDADGDFVVVWNEIDFSNADRILGRRFDAAGQPVGAQIVVDGASSFNGAPRAAFLPGDVLAVTWNDEVVAGTEEARVQLGFVRPNGSAPDRALVVNPVNHDGSSFLPDVAASRVGDLVVGWQVGVVDETDADDIYARLYRSPVSYIVSSTTASTTEASRQPVTFTVARGGVVGATSTVGYRFTGTARFGDDYSAAMGNEPLLEDAGTIVFAPGELTKTIALTMVDDTIGEPQQSIVLELRDPRPDGAATISFPIAVVTLGDDDLAEVRVLQTQGSTVVGAGIADELTVALRTAPTGPVTVMLTPSIRELDLGAGWGATNVLRFAPGATGMAPQTVRIRATGEAAAAALAAGAFVRLAAESVDPAYDLGARFTVDGRDGAAVEVNIAGELPPIFGVYLPLARR
jgi:hypothetical protein